MALTVRQSKGVFVEYGEDGIALDPDRKVTDLPIFVTHAHGDHASSFKNPEPIKYATEPTYRLLEALSWKKLDNWKPCLLYTSPSPRDRQRSRMPSSA